MALKITRCQTKLKSEAVKSTWFLQMYQIINFGEYGQFLARKLWAAVIWRSPDQRRMAAFTSLWKGTTVQTWTLIVIVKP